MNVLAIQADTVKHSSKAPVGKEGSVEHLHQVLQEMAVTFKFKPGERLNESVLSEQLGVSRTPLREALNRLTAEGFFDFASGKGFFCRPLEPKLVLDLYGLREALERACVRSAVDNATEQEIDELEDFVQKTSIAYEEHLGTELLRIDEYFHESIAGLSNNQEILRSLKNVNARIRFVRWVDMDDEKSLVPDEHLSILAAIRKRDKQMALERISSHIQMRIAQIHANLKEGYSRIYMGGGTA